MRQFSSALTCAACNPLCIPTICLIREGNLEQCPELEVAQGAFSSSKLFGDWLLREVSAAALDAVLPGYSIIREAELVTTPTMESVQAHVGATCTHPFAIETRLCRDTRVPSARGCNIAASQCAWLRSDALSRYPLSRLLSLGRGSQNLQASLAAEGLLSNAAKLSASSSLPRSASLSQARRPAWIVRVGPDTLSRTGEDDTEDKRAAFKGEAKYDNWQEPDAGRTAASQSGSRETGGNASLQWGQTTARDVYWQADDESSESYSSDEDELDTNELEALPSAALTVLGDGPQVSDEGEASDQEGFREQGSRMVDRVWELIERVQAGDGETVKLGDVKAIFSFPIDKFQVGA